MIQTIQKWYCPKERMPKNITFDRNISEATFIWILFDDDEYPIPRLGYARNNLFHGNKDIDFIDTVTG